MAGPHIAVRAGRYSTPWRLIALDDAVEPHIGITNTTVIVADSSKFGYRALTESPVSTISTS